jgi:hypothetical protein
MLICATVGGFNRFLTANFGFKVYSFDPGTQSNKEK